VADAHRLAVPYLVAAGPRDEAKGSVRLREASGLQRDLPIGSLGAELSQLCAPPASG
jgi:threonyl-tRNA synthetase